MIDSKPNKINLAVQKKAPLKSELCAQLKDLQEKYNALDKENTWNKAIINQLEFKVRQFEENDSLKIDKHPELESVSVQTEEMKESCLSSDVFVQTDDIIFCNKCDYQAENNIDLDGHTYSEHQ